MSCTLFLQQTFKNMKLEVYSHVTFLECTTTRCQKVLYFYVWKKKIEKSCMADGLLIEYYTADGSNKKMKSYLKANGTINFIGQQSFSFCKIIRKLYILFFNFKFDLNSILIIS